MKTVSYNARPGSPFFLMGVLGGLFGLYMYQRRGGKISNLTKPAGTFLRNLRQSAMRSTSRIEPKSRAGDVNIPVTGAQASSSVSEGMEPLSTT